MRRAVPGRPGALALLLVVLSGRRDFPSIRVVE